MKADVDARAVGVGVGVHLLRHSRRGRDVVGADDRRRARERGRLPNGPPEPVQRVFVFPRIARNAPRADPVGPRGHVAHAVAKPDGIGDHHRATGRRGVAHSDGAAGRRTTGREVVGAEVHPAVADLAVVDADLRAAAGVIDRVELIRAVRPRRGPGIHGVDPGGGDRRGVGGRGGLGAGIHGGVAVAGRVGHGAVVLVVPPRAGGARQPRARPDHVGGIVVDHHLGKLPADGPHRHHRRARPEEVVDVERELVLIAEILDERQQVATVGRVAIEHVAPLPAVPGRCVDDLPGQGSLRLAADRDEPLGRRQRESWLQRLVDERPGRGSPASRVSMEWRTGHSGHSGCPEEASPARRGLADPGEAPLK